MGKKKDLKRAIKDAEKHSSVTLLLPHKPHPDDDKLVQISMFITSGDRYRLKTLGLNLNNISLQRLGHRAWNALLVSHGQRELTPVSQGSSSNSRQGGD